MEASKHDLLETRKAILKQIGQIESIIEPKIIIPNDNETAVISDKPKTAALYYDRVWCPTIDVWGYAGKMPDEIRFFGGAVEECQNSFQIFSNKDLGKGHYPTLDKLKKSGKYEELIKKSILSLLKDQINAKNEEELKKVLARAADIPLHEREVYQKNTELISSCIFRDVALAFTKKYGKQVVTLFSTTELQDLMYYEGNESTIVTTLDNLKIVNEDALEWEQVRELRSDGETRDKYRRFFHWLDKEMIGKSQAFIEDDISIKLSDYEEALKKHGIKTIIGTVKEILDGKFLIGTGAVAGATALASEPIFGILAEAGLIIANLAINIAEKKLDYEDIEKGPNSEISWVYQVKNLRNTKVAPQKYTTDNQKDFRQLHIERARAAFSLLQYYLENKLYEKAEESYKNVVDVVENTNGEIVQVNDILIYSTMLFNIYKKDAWLSFLNNSTLQRAYENVSKEMGDSLRELLQKPSDNKK
ncbi:MAG: hypothetical protein OEV87_09090 [Phycisphaerae bacterium]|nr:hypothetical protein [Phycisphaerae bacterium]